MARSAKANKSDGAPSLLATAFEAYQKGDVVLARQASEQVLAGTPAEADQAAARTLGPKLVTGPEPLDAQAFARELLDRVKGPNKAYLFAGVTAAVYLLMLYLASRG